MMIAIWPLVICIAGALVYGLTKDKAAELGRIAFFCGLFWLTYSLLHATLKLG